MARKTKTDPVVLRPPLEVMRPRPAQVLPAEDALPGGTQYSIKLDGFRALAFVNPGPEGPVVVLQARSGRNLAPDFPELTAAIGTTLPEGSVVDGEIVAYREGRLEFRELLRSRAARAHDQIATAFVLFDLLALPGQDLRDRPLAERWRLLGEMLAGVGPVVQPVLATTSLTEARAWYEGLRDVGVEGVVARGLATAYRPTGSHSAWVKVRHADTTEAQLIGVLGSAARPRHLLLRLPDGTTALTTTQLDHMQAVQVAAALQGLLRPPGEEEGGPVWRLEKPMLVVEVRIAPGRHRTVRFVRVRAEGV